METINQIDPISGCHVVAMPLPGRGHTNPMISLCTLLIPSPKISTITLIVTEEWLGLISHQLPPAGSTKLRIRTIPNVLPSELTRGADLSGFYKAVYTKMEAPFEEVLLSIDSERLEPPVTCIVYDVFLSWVVGVGRRRNIPLVAFWTQAPSVFSVYHHFDLIADRGHVPNDNLPLGKEQEIIDYLPGVRPVRLMDLPIPTTNVNIILEAFSLLTKAQSIIFTSFYELQPNVINALRPNLHIPIYTIGPSIPFLSLKPTPLKSITTNEDGYMNWLNSQPETSVLYVSFGSFLSTSKDQMEELSLGLQASGARYLWIVQAGQEPSLKAECCEEKGFMVPWCDQLRVLSHRSVGGFLTHCGWNSAMESIFAGVPMLTFPLRWEQVHNSKIIVEDLGVGEKLKRVVGLESVIRREEIAEMVKRFMDLNGKESREMRRRAKELQETCRKAIDTGGSTNASVTNFVESICHSTS